MRSITIIRVAAILMSSGLVGAPSASLVLADEPPTPAEPEAGTAK